MKLEVDRSIIERNLVVVDRSPSPQFQEVDPISQLLNSSRETELDDIPWKYVRPTAGFCVKTRTNEGDKVFINICHTEDIPAPKEISDEELIEILESDEAPQYTVPLSLGEVHLEPDKSGNISSVYDVAINTQFLCKITKNELFQTFFLTVVMEGVQSKYKLELPLQESKPYVILKNRKQMGTLQTHRIQLRPRKPEKPKKLIEVISSKEEPVKPNAGKGLPIQTISTAQTVLPVNEKNRLKVYKKDSQFVLVLAKIKALTGNDIELNVSDNRLIISCDRNEPIDCTLPLSVKPAMAFAQYFVNLQVLKVILPIDGAEPSQNITQITTDVESLSEIVDISIAKGATPLDTIRQRIPGFQL